ncbi:MAG: AMP-binding protein [Rhodospirillales bacterium]|nr:AMP-binding protein [Rhodospirillales bacterium]
MTPAASYVCGTGTEKLRYQTIGAALEATVASHAGELALVVPHQNIRWTWRELAHETERVATGLRQCGLVAGDRLGIWAPNRAEWVLTQLACARAGLILVTINPAYRVSELEHALNLAGCRALVLAERYRGSEYVPMLRALLPELGAVAGPLQAARAPALRTVVVIGDAQHAGCLRFADLVADVPGDAEAAPPLSPDDPINVQFTSGTTGAPKGATLTHHNILNNGFFVGERMRLTHLDRVCIPVPLYHCFGMVMGVLNCVTHGAAMVFPSEAFEPAAVLQAVEAERCTALYGVPTMFLAVLDCPGFAAADLTSLRTGIMSGAPCPAPLMQRVLHDLHMSEITICYGMTETSPVIFQTMPDATIEARIGTAGRIQPHLEAKIVDAAGAVVPIGSTGELLVRGYGVMRGYWNDPARTDEAIDVGGWMHTGDLAAFDEAEQIRIVGRATDMIIRGGENVYPAEVEAFLLRHPQVRDVAVFGIACETFGQQVCAWIRLDQPGSVTEDEIRAFCRGQIAGYKIPKEIRFVDEFPMTVTGKVQKFQMRAAMGVGPAA